MNGILMADGFVTTLGQQSIFTKQIKFSDYLYIVYVTTGIDIEIQWNLYIWVYSAQFRI